MSDFEKNNRNNLGAIIKRVIIGLGFLICIFFPILDYPLKWSSEYENTENRKFAKLPDFDLRKLEDFPRQMDKYYNDNFNFRGELLELRTWLRLNALNISPVKEVVFGKDNWFYHSKYIDTYVNRKLFTDVELDSFKTIYTERTEWLAKQGVKHYLFIVPNKTQVYPEFLPDYISKFNEKSRTQQVLKVLDSVQDLKVHYLGEDLLADKNNGGLRSFHRTDQHWNKYGALIGIKGILEVLKQDFPNLQDFDINNYEIDSVTRKGMSLAKMLKKQDEISETKINVKKKGWYRSKLDFNIKYPVPANFPYKKVHQLYKKVNEPSLPKAVIIRDSYANAMNRELAEYFEESAIIWDVWCYLLHQDIVEGEKPDMYITILIEGNLPFVLYKHPTMRGEVKMVPAKKLNKKFKYDKKKGKKKKD